MIKTLPKDLPLATTRAHLARLLDTTTATLERAELLGLLRTHRTGGNVIIFRDDVLEYLRNRKGGSKNVTAN